MLNYWCHGFHYYFSFVPLCAGEAWQDIMMSLSPYGAEIPGEPIRCIPTNSTVEVSEEVCGTALAFPYFISFSLLCTFLVSILRFNSLLFLNGTRIRLIKQLSPEARFTRFESWSNKKLWQQRIRIFWMIRNHQTFTYPWLWFENAEFCMRHYKARECMNCLVINILIKLLLDSSFIINVLNVSCSIGTQFCLYKLYARAKQV